MKKKKEDAGNVIIDGEMRCAECHGELPCPEHQPDTFKRAQAAVMEEAKRLGLKVSKE